MKDNIKVRVSSCIGYLFIPISLIKKKLIRSNKNIILNHLRIGFFKEQNGFFRKNKIFKKTKYYFGDFKQYMTYYKCPICKREHEHLGYFVNKLNGKTKIIMERIK
jgi:hypothetical protein